MDQVTALLHQGRDAYQARDWVTAREALGAARALAPLSPADLYLLSDCSWWMGDLDTALPIQQEAYRLHVAAGEPRAAALVALDVGYTLTLRGDDAQGSGWLALAGRHLADEPEGFEHGFLVYVDFEMAFGAGDLETALTHAVETHRIGTRYGDANLRALGVLGQGRVMVKQGRVAAGMALLDEAMVAATSEDLSPGWAGNIYCHLMIACHELGDLMRASEWTNVTARWCQGMPGAGPFMGICRIHRAEILRVHGAWQDAVAEARTVRESMAGFHVSIVAEAEYETAEVHRMRGELESAAAAYDAAHRLGRDPQPGLALLRLQQGDVAAARSLCRTALATAPDPLARARLLPAAVEIYLGANDVGAAREASTELAAIAETFGTAGLRAPARAAEGMVRLAEGDPAGAVEPLRAALHDWQALDAPYDAARVRVILARAYAALGDRDAAARESRVAMAALRALGAATQEVEAAPSARRTDGLTAREAEILGLVAQGRTNQEIAAALVLSIRTVERHLATAYQKLGLRGRSARAAAVGHILQGR